MLKTNSGFGKYCIRTLLLSEETNKTSSFFCSFVLSFIAKKRDLIQYPGTRLEPSEVFETNHYKSYKHVVRSKSYRGLNPAPGTGLSLSNSSTRFSVA
jgi:hypothetical protein